MTCILCGAAGSELVSDSDRHGATLVTRHCGGCGLVFNDPIPTDSELSEFYARRYRIAYKGSYRPRGRQIVRNFRRVAEHFRLYKDVISPARSVLDVGAGSGEFLFGVAASARTAVGIEPNREYADYCRQALALDVRTDELRPELFEDATFDFIRLNHVLEHLNDPVGSVNMIARFLSPSGILHVEVPNIEVYATSKSRGRMFHYGHVFNFNPWTLRAVAGLAGFDEVQNSTARTANSTGIFLKKSAEPWTPADVCNEDNAARVRALLRRHGEGRATPAARAAKPMRKLYLRAGETLVSWRYGSPQDIGRAILGKVL